MTRSATTPDKPILAVYGGSFNPPHIGHLMFPGLVLARGLADAVALVPCFEHAFAKRLYPFDQRHAWLRRDIARIYGSGPESKVEVSTIESELAAQGACGGRSLDMLRALAERRPGWRLRLVLGSDIIESGEYERWYRWPEIRREFAPIVIPRPSAGGGDLPWVSSSQLRAWLADRSNPSVDQQLRRFLSPSALTSLCPDLVEGAARQRSSGVLDLEQDTQRAFILGAGNAGSCLGRWLRRRGWRVEIVGARVWRTDPSAYSVVADEYDLVCFAVDDRELAGVAQAWAQAYSERPLPPVVHMSGALRAEDCLAPLVALGLQVGSLHPIASLRRELPDMLDTAGFGVEAGGELQRLLDALVEPSRQLNLNGLSAARRRAYHACCALVANHLRVPIDAARPIFSNLGAEGDGPLLTLMTSALANLQQLGVERGLTGPLARGDQQAVQGHLAALKAEADAGEDARGLYSLLSGMLARTLGLIP